MFYHWCKPYFLKTYNKRIPLNPIYLLRAVCFNLLKKLSLLIVFLLNGSLKETIYPLLSKSLTSFFLVTLVRGELSTFPLITASVFQLYFSNTAISGKYT